MVKLKRVPALRDSALAQRCVIVKRLRSASARRESVLAQRMLPVNVIAERHVSVQRDAANVKGFVL